MIDDDSWDLNGDEKLDVGEAGFFSFRTAEMQGVHRLNVDRNLDEIYLYVLDTASKEGVEGDMPLGSQYGFLFGTPDARTIAHEIAHGYFQLEHTFSDKYKLGQGATDNLMDYASGAKLYKYQWDLMHAKGLKLFSFLQDSAGRKWGSQYGIYIHQLANFIAIINKLQLKKYIKEVSLNDLVSYTKDLNDFWKNLNSKYQNLTNEISLNSKILQILNNATTYSDQKEFQTGEYSYRHAMRNSSESIEEAKAKSDSFVKNQFIKAKTLQKQGQIDKAYFEFGIALHTIQDATSSAHAGFQVWTGKESIYQEINHVSKELIYPGIESELQKVTNKYLNWFESINNEPIPTTNIFNEINFDK